MKKLFVKFLLVALLIFWAPAVSAAESYPKLANYYLSWFDHRHYDELARYDLLILQPEMIFKNNSFFKFYRQKQASGLLLAYLYPASFYTDTIFYDYWSLRNPLLAKINEENWWLRDERGVVVNPWLRTGAVNITQTKWQDYNLSYLTKHYRLNQWDGMFWDLVDSESSKYSTYALDVNADGVTESTALSNQLWQQGMSQFLKKSRASHGDKISVINGNSLPTYQSNINGRMFEHFPTPWEADGSWSASMKQYLTRLPRLNVKPNVYIINAMFDNQASADIYQQMRFALASTLLGDGYFSFDHGAMSHSQLWWFDEYDLDLGLPLQRALNTTASTLKVELGLWQREFQHGLVLVNSSNERQFIDLPVGKYQRFKGYQAPEVNDGCGVQRVDLDPNDAVILLKTR